MQSPRLQQECSASFSKETCCDLDVSTRGPRECKPKAISYRHRGWSHTTEKKHIYCKSFSPGPKLPCVLYWRGFQSPAGAGHSRSPRWPRQGLLRELGGPVSCARLQEAGAHKGLPFPNPAPEAAATLLKSLMEKRNDVLRRARASSLAESSPRRWEVCSPALPRAATAAACSSLPEVLSDLTSPLWGV